jgi:hypothetical protein
VLRVLDAVALDPEVVAIVHTGDGRGWSVTGG